MLRIYKDSLKALNRNMKLFFIVVIFEGIVMGLNDTLYNIYLQTQGYSQTTMGEIAGITSLAFLLFTIIGGIISDKIGRNKSMILGGIVSSFMLLGRIVVNDVNLVLCFNFLNGIGYCLYMVSCSPFMAVEVEPEHRVSVFSLVFAALNASSIFGYFLGGAIPDLLASEGISLLLSQEITLYGGVVASFAMIVPLFFTRQSTQRSAITDKPNELVKSSTSSFFNVLKTMPRSQQLMIFRLNISQLFVSVGSALIVPLLGIFLMTRFEISSTIVGGIMSLGQLTMVLTTLLGPLLAKKYGLVLASSILQFASIPFMLLLGHTNFFPLAVISYLIRGSLMNAANPLQSTVLMDHVNEEYRGFANGVMDMSFNLGRTIFSGLSGSLSEQYGFGLVYNIASLFYALGALAYYFFNRHLKDATS